MDPIVTPLLALVLRKMADDIIGGACTGYLEDKLKGLFSKWRGNSGDIHT